MAEQLDLATPIAPPQRTTYRISRVVLDWDAQVIQITLVGSDGLEVRAEYTGAIAVGLMTVLNTTNLATLSLQKRILQKLVTDGKLPAGTVSGTPA
jgi:hypothetical protein